VNDEGMEGLMKVSSFVMHPSFEDEDSGDEEEKASCPSPTVERCKLDDLPMPYLSLRFSVTTYRWQGIDDCVRGVPVVEIRPYNKSDGKRYVYVKVDGIEEMLSQCATANIVAPKARFNVERCTDSSVLGFLSIKEPVEKDKMKPDEVEPTSEDIELSKNLTLLISEKIVKQLDKEGIGRGSPPPDEHKLRIVVALVMPTERETDEPTLVEVALLPFFRIKRRQKRRHSSISSSRSVDFFPKKPALGATMYGMSPLENRVVIDEVYHSKVPAPLINTAPNSKHFADFFCARCGPDKNVKLLEAGFIFYVNATCNEIWATSGTRNCRVESTSTAVHQDGQARQYEVQCRFCRAQVGVYYTYEVKNSATVGQRNQVFKLFYVDPADLSPLLFYRWSGAANLEEIDGVGSSSDSEYDKSYIIGEASIPTDEIKTPPELDMTAAIALTRSKVGQGWVGRPLLESEYPDYPGAYASMDSVRPITCPFPGAQCVKPESKLLELIHSNDCSSDAAWTCRASLPIHESSLLKLKPLTEQYEVLRLMHLLEWTNPAKLSSRELEMIRDQLYEKICTVFNG
jgi:hypothetical protein